MRYWGNDKYFSTDWAKAGETARGQVTKGLFNDAKIFHLYFQDKGEVFKQASLTEIILYR